MYQKDRGSLLALMYGTVVFKFAELSTTMHYHGARGGRK